MPMQALFGDGPPPVDPNELERRKEMYGSRPTGPGPRPLPSGGVDGGPGPRPLPTPEELIKLRMEMQGGMGGPGPRPIPHKPMLSASPVNQTPPIIPPAASLMQIINGGGFNAPPAAPPMNPPGGGMQSINGGGFNAPPNVGMQSMDGGQFPQPPPSQNPMQNPVDFRQFLQNPQILQRIMAMFGNGGGFAGLNQ